MKASIDSMGRLVIPKALRDGLGLVPGSEVDISEYGSGLQIQPGSRTARIRAEGDRFVIAGSTVVDDELMYALIDAGRR